jgi:hypothetical protein
MLVLLLFFILTFTQPSLEEDDSEPWFWQQATQRFCFFSLLPYFQLIVFSFQMLTRKHVAKWTPTIPNQISRAWRKMIDPSFMEPEAYITLRVFLRKQYKI